MKNKSILLFLFLFSFIVIISCKKKYNPEEEELKGLKTADSLVTLAYKKFYSKDYQEAYSLCNLAITKKLGHQKALLLMGKVQFELEAYSRAIEFFTIVINDPGIMEHYEMDEVYQKRAFAKEALEDYRGALVDYDILVNSFNSRYGYYHRGILKHNFLDDANGACSDWRVAGEKGEGRAYDLIAKFCNN